MKQPIRVERGLRLAALGAIVGGVFTMGTVVSAAAAIGFPGSTLGVTVNGNAPNSITVNDKIFSNFTCTISTSQGTVSLTQGGCSGVTITPLPIGTAGLDPTANNYAGISIGGGFSANAISADATLDFKITYDLMVDPNSSNKISDVHMSFDLDAVGFAFTQVSETINAAEFVAPFTISVFDNNPLPDQFSQQSQMALLPVPVKKLSVSKDIKLIAFCNADQSGMCVAPQTGGNFSSGSIIDQRFSQVPEPASLGILGSGLIGLGWLARRRRKVA
jgi:hypothetical protein